MFTEGQLIFAIFFLVSFLVIITLSYRRDKKIHHKNYKNVKWVLIGFIVFIVIITIIKYMIKK